MEVDSYPQAHRILWKIVGLALAIFSIFYGVGYAFEGNKYATQPSLHILRELPGHMHTHGWVLITIGVALIIEVVNVDQETKRVVMMIFCGYSILTTVTIFGSWWVTHIVQFSTPWFWVTDAVISGALIALPPPPRSKGKVDA